MEIISEHGILNSSVASIAERAGVSVGYLYRHYPGKVDLINDLLEDALRTITDRIYALADETNDIRKIVRGIVEFIIESAATNRPKHKFLIMLLNCMVRTLHSTGSIRISGNGSGASGIR